MSAEGKAELECPEKEIYEPPQIEVIVLGSAEALLGVCFVVAEGGGGCLQPFATSA
mgnify:CR=1 FL=1